MNILIRNTLILVFSLNVSQVQAMGLIDFFTIHVFSDVTGIVTMNGEPVEGAELIRTADHENDKVYTDSALTDKNGKFSFEGISTFSLRPIMLGTIIRQRIIVKYKGMEYLAWKTVKHNNHLYGELNDVNVKNPKKLNFACELTDKQDNERRVELESLDGIIVGLCKW